MKHMQHVYYSSNHASETQD